MVEATKHWFANGNLDGVDQGPISKRLAEYSPAIIRPRIWREFKPMKDRWEFTIFFRLGNSVEKSMKCRGDFEIDHEDYVDITEDRFFELCQLAVLDACLWIVEMGHYRPDWNSSNAVLAAGNTTS